MCIGYEARKWCLEWVCICNLANLGRCNKYVGEKERISIPTGPMLRYFLCLFHKIAYIRWLDVLKLF